MSKSKKPSAPVLSMVPKLSDPPPAAPVQGPPPITLRWQATITQLSNGQGVVNLATETLGVTDGEIADVLLQVTAELGRHRNSPVLTTSQQLSARKAAIAKDYPASTNFPAVGVHLCAACADAFGGILEGPAFPEPTGGEPIPCSYHAYEAGIPGFPKPPMPIKEACAKLAAAPEPDEEC